jgi:hypothetical protein
MLPWVLPVLWALSGAIWSIAVVLYAADAEGTGARAAFDCDPCDAVQNFVNGALWMPVIVLLALAVIAVVATARHHSRGS